MKADGEDLLEAVRERKRGIAKSLIQSRASLNYTNSFGWTALHWAADRGLLEVTNMLLDYNADVNARDLNEATPIIAAARANCMGTARALMARGARLDLLDEWEDSAVTIAQSVGNTKMSAQLKSASKGPLDRLAGAKVVFSFPPSLLPHLSKLINEVRKVRGGEGIYGLSEEVRMVVDVVKDMGADDGEAEEEGGDGDGPASSPTKVTWAGPEVTWCQACARATLAVQIAADGEEYKQHEACQEQTLLLQIRRQVDGCRHRLKEDALNVLPIKEEEAPPSAFWDEVERLREEVVLSDNTAERLRHRLRHFDDRVLSDRGYLTRLNSIGEGPTLRADRKEELEAFQADVAQLDEAVKPLLERVHEVLKNARHARLEENITIVEEAIAKLKTKILPLPKEPSRDASSKEQETYKAEHAKIKGDNEKFGAEIAQREKQLKTLNEKLKTDLKTLEKPHPAPPFLVQISERHFTQLDAAGLTLWLNWQSETNGGSRGAGKAKKKQT